MAQQKRVTDFFLLPRTSKSPAFLPRTPLFDLNNKAVMRKRRLTVQDNDVTQTTLDAGQKIIGGQYCQVCDMIYSIDSITEVEMHKKFHNRNMDITQFRVTVTQLNSWKKKDAFVELNGRYIFCIRPDSKSTLKTKAIQIIEEFVNVNVGFSSDLSLWGIDIRRTIWLCVLNEANTFFIASVIITEPVREAQWLGTGELVSDGEPILGVNRIWTHPQARRKGVATTVLDIIRRKFLLGEVLPKHRVAFSDPTDDGRRFAEHYMQDCKESIISIMVYTATK